MDTVARCGICIGAEIEGGTNKYINHSTVTTINSPSCSVLLHTLYRRNVCRLCQHYKYHIINNSHEKPLSPVDSMMDESTVYDKNEAECANNDVPDPIFYTTDASEMFDHSFPNINPTLSEFLWAQSQCSVNKSQGKDPRQRRWPKSVIGGCIKLWITSPASYRCLAQFM